MFSNLLSRRCLQFRLRTLLLLTLAAAIGCCWFVPFAKEEHWPDGTVKARYQVQRTWDGSLIAAGEQWEFYEHSGQLERHWVQHGGPPGGECDGKHCTHWNADGQTDRLGGEHDHLIWLITRTMTPDTWVDGGLSGRSKIIRCTITCSFGDDLPSAEESLADLPQPEDFFAP